MEQKIGLPLAANAKERQLVAMRTFFREIQDDPHNLPRQFDALRVFRTPNTIKKQIGPNPRDLDPFNQSTMRTRRDAQQAMHLYEMVACILSAGYCFCRLALALRS